MTYPTLNTEGFLITQVANEWAMFGADFGDGLSVAQLDGDPEGRRSWAITIAALPGDHQAAKLADNFTDPGFVLREVAPAPGASYVLAENGGRLILERAHTRAAYLWNFFHNSKRRGDQPFWIEMEDPATGTRQTYLASFVTDRISYAVLCAKIYSTGLELIERRVPPATTMEVQT